MGDVCVNNLFEIMGKGELVISRAAKLILDEFAS